MSYGWFIKKEISVRHHCYLYPEAIREYLRQRKPFARRKLRYSKRKAIEEYEEEGV